MKYKILFVSPIVLINLFKVGIINVRCVAGLPEDVKFVRAFTDDTTGWNKIGLVIESEQFDKLKEGDVIPTFPDPTFENLA